MWCLRYFTLLALLPFSNASPLFSILFLVSLIIFSKPCGYCSILLLGIYLASCSLSTTGRYWIDLNQGHLLSPILRHAPSFADASHNAPLPSPSPLSTLVQYLIARIPVSFPSFPTTSLPSWLKQQYEISAMDGIGLKVNFGLGTGAALGSRR